MKGIRRPEAAAEAASRYQCAKKKLRTFIETVVVRMADVNDEWHIRHYFIVLISVSC
ncbi:hypothetical protein PUN4_180024 [Paraburkholderia unamae]|nr:hypothetical protein PUN4_180024 [Paraburkholderia unamae]